MNSLHIIYHIARADFLERVRRYSFLVMLMLSIFLGYQIAIGNMSLYLGAYRGEFNSAWVGAMMSVNATFFLGWFGFYLVKGAVARDNETGVGQIMATTPMTRPVYMLGKWISNFAVLTAMVIVLALAGIVIQWMAGESTRIELGAYLSSFIYVVLPLMALVAALAVLFEAIPFLKGGFGNIAYFFLFIFTFTGFLASSIFTRSNSPFAVLEPTGMVLYQQNMGVQVSALDPSYSGSFTLGPSEISVPKTFHWNGIDWTPTMILGRFSFVGLAALLTMLAALFFDRFDPSRSRPRKTAALRPASAPDVLPAAPSHALTAVRLTPLAASVRHFSFFNVLTAEMKLLLKGQRWWWYAVAVGLIVAGLFSPAEIARTFILPAAWVWPILIWSGLGNREIHNNTHQMVFSSAAPLWRQIPATWLAGFLVTLLTGSGVALKLLTVGDVTGLLAWTSAAVFIPSFALACGVWSNSSKLFEVAYILLWYLGPMNRLSPIDYMGAHGSGNIAFFIPFSIVLTAIAFVGRSRQLQN